jgi:short-subunit dehydrogenase
MKECVATLVRNESRIDVLINNAGFALNAAIEDIPVADAKYQFEVNVFGMSRLIQLALPYMRSQRSGKIINISSVAGKVSSPMAGWYHASKHAVEAISDSLRAEVKQFGIDVVVIQPGAVKSEFDGIAKENTLKFSGNGAYKDLARSYIANIEKYHPRASEPDVIVKLIQKAITSKVPKTRYAGGFMAKPLLFLNKVLSDRAFDALILSQMKAK